MSSSATSGSVKHFSESARLSLWPFSIFSSFTNFSKLLGGGSRSRTGKHLRETRPRSRVRTLCPPPRCLAGARPAALRPPPPPPQATPRASQTSRSPYLRRARGPVEARLSAEHRRAPRHSPRARVSPRSPRRHTGEAHGPGTVRRFSRTPRSGCSLLS